MKPNPMKKKSLKRKMLTFHWIWINHVVSRGTTLTQMISESKLIPDHTVVD